MEGGTWIEHIFGIDKWIPLHKPNFTDRSLNSKPPFNITRI